MFRKFVAPAILISLGYVFASVPFSVAGTIAGQKIDQSANYEFTDCSEPTAPFIAPTNSESYNEAVYAYNDYIKATNDYLRCITDEANADMKSQTALIMEAHRAESEAVRASTEQSRKRLHEWRNASKK